MKSSIFLLQSRSLEISKCSRYQKSAKIPSQKSMNVARFMDYSFWKVNITEKLDRDWSIGKVCQSYFVMNFQMMENQVEN